MMSHLPKATLWSWDLNLRYDLPPFHGPEQTMEAKRREEQREEEADGCRVRTQVKGMPILEMCSSPLWFSM